MYCDYAMLICLMYQEVTLEGDLGRGVLPTGSGVWAPPQIIFLE